MSFRGFRDRWRRKFGVNMRSLLDRDRDRDIKHPSIHLCGKCGVNVVRYLEHRIEYLATDRQRHLAESGASFSHSLPGGLREPPSSRCCQRVSFKFHLLTTYLVFEALTGHHHPYYFGSKIENIL